MFKRTNKLAMPVIMVAKGDQALPTGTLTSATTALNLANGQLGVVSWDYKGTKPLGTYIAATDDATEVNQIRIVAGTPASSATQNADLWGAGDKAYIESDVIKNNMIRSVATRKARFPRLGGAAGTNFPTPANNTEYDTVIRLVSVKNDRDYGNNDEVITTTVPGLDFTTLGTVSPKDYVLKSTVDQINRQSRVVAQNAAFSKGNRNVLALGIKIAGGVGQALGTIAVGTTFNVYTTNGQTTAVTADAAMVRALATLVQDNAALTVTSSVVNVDMATAGTVADVDAIIVLGLQELPAAYFDNIDQSQVRVDLSFGAGWLTAATKPVITKSYPDEGTGRAASWRILSGDRYRLGLHTLQNVPYGEYFAEGNDYIDTGLTKMYTSYIIEFYDLESVLNTHVQSPKTVTMLFPCEKDSTFTFNVTNVVTRLNGGLTPVPMVTSNDAGTGTASVNTVPGVVAVLDQWLESARVRYGFELVGDAVVGGPYLT